MEAIHRMYTSIKISDRDTRYVLPVWKQYTECTLQSRLVIEIREILNQCGSNTQNVLFTQEQ